MRTDAFATAAVPDAGEIRTQPPDRVIVSPRDGQRGKADGSASGAMADRSPGISRVIRDFIDPDSSNRGGVVPGLTRDLRDVPGSTKVPGQARDGTVQADRFRPTKAGITPADLLAPGTAGAAARDLGGLPDEHRREQLKSRAKSAQDGDCGTVAPAFRVPGFAAPEQEQGPTAPATLANPGSDHDAAAAVDRLVGMPLTEIERRVIEATIRACGESLPTAARILGVSPSTLYRKRAAWTGQPGGG